MRLTPDEYLRLYRQHGTHAAVARAIGRDLRSLQRWRKRNGVVVGDDPAPEPQTDPDAEKLLPLLKGGRSIGDLADAVDKSPATVKRWLADLQTRGYNLAQAGESWRLDTYVAPAEARVDHSTREARLRIGIVSDTHLGSKQQQLSHLEDFYARCQAAGVTDVYHAGDLLAGDGVYKGQTGEIFQHGEDDQVDYAAEAYPRREGVRTHVIGGNHDLVFVMHGGADPIRQLAAMRDDIDYLGPYSAWVQLAPNCVLYLVHGAGATAYAISYKLQKLIESFEGGRKPHLAAVGHWHQRAYMFARNVHGMLAGCFEAQTDFERRRALQPQIGGTILELEFADDGSVQTVKPEFVTYLVPKERDW